MLVQIDSREKDRVKSASEYFKNQGLDVEVCELKVGDYLFDHKVVFEMKLISDFVSSIQNGKIFNQAINQTEEYNHHYVIIHGDLHSRSKALAMTRNYHQVTLYQYLGAIASLNRYTTVIETYSPYLEESYYRMLVQANKSLSTKPVVRKFPRKDKNPAFNFLCHDVYGINSKKAQLIVDTYNLNNLVDLFTLTWKDLLEIKGIGEDTAKRIIEALYGGKRYYLSETPEEVWKK